MKSKSYFSVPKAISGIAYKSRLLIIVVFVFAVSCTSKWEIDNPYESVDWQAHKQYKANFHTHTTRSDGRVNPQTVIDRYHELGYDILAITDHNEVTFPWTGFSGMQPSNTSLNRIVSAPETMPENFIYEDRDPITLEMIDIQGNELSRHHHMGSFFNDHNGTATEVESLDATAAKKGVTMFNHPGRYNKTIGWYVDLYEKYNHLVGLEIFNQGDRFPDDRAKWDSILTVVMPGRPVWGFSNDDMHSASQIGRNWNMLILPELTDEWVRTGMEKGLSYFVYSPQGHNGPEVPVINSIVVNNRKNTIEIEASGYDSVQWISEGKLVRHGVKVDLDELEQVGSYLRAMFYGPGETVVGTQPFGIRKKD